MRAVFGVVGILMALGIGCFIYSSQIRQATNNKPVAQQINFVAIRGDLLSLGQSERLYFATNGSYATIEQLQQSPILNSVPAGNRLGYRYTIEAEGSEHFRITASPTDSSRADLPTLSIDETLQISQ